MWDSVSWESLFIFLDVCQCSWNKMSQGWPVPPSPPWALINTPSPSTDTFFCHYRHTIQYVSMNLEERATWPALSLTQTKAKISVSNDRILCLSMYLCRSLMGSFGNILWISMHIYKEKERIDRNRILYFSTNICTLFNSTKWHQSNNSQPPRISNPWNYLKFIAGPLATKM
jgi:hypothetical protein